MLLDKLSFQNNQNMNFKQILIPLLILLFFSCEKEEAVINNESYALVQAEGSEVPTASNRNSFSFCYEEIEPEDVATINPCTTSFPLDPITETLPFSYFNTQDLINELNDVFYCHEQFSVCQGAFQPQEICTRVFSLYDTKVFAIPSPAYPYFSSAITPSLSNQIMQHFACDMVNYGDQNYSNYQIAHVSFVSDQLLCNTCADGIGDMIYLRAYVHYYIY